MSANLSPREQRGLVIAATAKLVQKGKVWVVPSQTAGGKKYTVCPDPETPYCSCPDFDSGCGGDGVCKHLHAVTFTIQREQGANGTVTETRTLSIVQKQTYAQNWPAYNLAQTTEKHRLFELLSDLCKGIEEPPAAKTGRPRARIADVVFMACLKIYTTLSSRRFGSDLADAHAKGYVQQKMHPMTVCSFLENPMLTPVLEALIARSALPLKSVEKDFAVDSTGFTSSRFIRWFDQKYGCVRQEHTWCKAHAVCGVKTNVITAVRILDRDAADCPQFKPLVEATAKNFTMDEVSADKAYLSVENIEAAFAVGAVPYIAFKANSTGKAGGLFEKMYHYYAMNKEEYAAHYHKRSNIESCFSMAKAKFGDGVRSKTDVAMRNEVLAKVLCHNLCCLIQSQCELGIEPVFWGKETEVLPRQEAASSPVCLVAAPAEKPAQIMRRTMEVCGA
jgi:transposase/predicted nucleic acid-binding Zn finger protein